MTNVQVKALEKLQKDAVYDILELGVTANYKAVLTEAGLFTMEDVVKMRKVNFVHEVCHSRPVNRCRDLLKAEQNSTPEKGLIAEVKKYCDEAGLADVSNVHLR